MISILKLPCCWLYLRVTVWRNCNSLWLFGKGFGDQLKYEKQLTMKSLYYLFHHTANKSTPIKIASVIQITILVHFHWRNWQLIGCNERGHDIDSGKRWESIIGTLIVRKNEPGNYKVVFSPPLLGGKHWLATQHFSWVAREPSGMHILRCRWESPSG